MLGQRAALMFHLDVPVGNTRYLNASGTAIPASHSLAAHVMF
jgi:hypothetical protein